MIGGSPQIVDDQKKEEENKEKIEDKEREKKEEEKIPHKKNFSFIKKKVHQIQIIIMQINYQILLIILNQIKQTMKI